VFGELTLALWDGRFEVTGGLRYFEDEVRDREKSAQNSPTGIPPAGLTSADSKFDNVSPRVVLAWHPHKESTVYASYGEGFRSGLNQLPAVRRAAPAFPAVEPDQLQSYEIGAKGSLWDGRIKFDTAVFYIDWQDVQQSLLVFVTGTTANNALVNAGSASGEGAEFGFSIDPIDGLVLSANFSWNDLEVDSDVFSGTTLLFPKGTRLLLSPERTIGASAEYAFPLAWGLEGRVSAGMNYFPSMMISRTNATTFSTSDDIRIVRASLGIESSNNWTASLFAENLGNEEEFTARDQFSSDWNTSLRPRTIGLQIEYRF
jgi:outer membrane receptor protein involved in Fe transport